VMYRRQRHILVAKYKGRLAAAGSGSRLPEFTALHSALWLTFSPAIGLLGIGAPGTQKKKWDYGPLSAPPESRLHNRRAGQLGYYLGVPNTPSSGWHIRFRMFRISV